VCGRSVGPLTPLSCDFQDLAQVGLPKPDLERDLHRRTRARGNSLVLQTLNPNP